MPSTDLKRCVLVVDDSRVMREMVVASLRPHGGLGFSHAASGLEAIEKLTLERFDLMVLDLNMPDVTGIEVLEFVRSQDTLRALPIMVVTSRSDDSTRAQVLKAGATRFMTKPFKPEVILREVQSILSGPLPHDRAP